MKRARAIALVILVTLQPLLLPIPASGAGAGGSPEWWDADWHMRVPVTVTNTLGTPLDNHVARVELSLADLLASQGWPGFPSGGGIQLQAFQLDEASLRVVEYSNLDPPGSGVGNGRVLEEVPARFSRGWLDQQEPSPYNNATNPIVTVTWLLPGTTEPEAQRFFYVYFDTLANGAKPPADDLPFPPFLDNEYYVGRGMRLYGYAHKVHVVGLHDETTVSVHRYVTPAKIALAEVPEGTEATNPFELDEGETVTFGLGTPTPVPVVVQSDKPVLVTGGGRGLIPAHEGLLVGRAFTIPGASDPYSDPGAPERQYAVTTAGVRSEVDAGGQPFVLDPRRPTVRGISRGTIEVASGDPVLVQALPPGGLIQAPSVDGAPSGTELRGFVWTWKTHDHGDKGNPPGIQDHFYGGQFVAIAPDEPSAGHFSVFGTEEQVFPRNKEQFATVVEPGAPAGVGNQGVVERFTVPEHPDQAPAPLVLRVDPRETPDGRLMAWVGSLENDEFTRGSLVQDASGTTGPARVVTPYAGVGGGLQFEGVWRAEDAGDTISVFSFYNNTDVTLILPDEPVPSRATLARHEHRELPVTGAWRLQATKPVAVLPMFVTGFFPSVLESPPIDVGGAEFHGPLVSLSPGQDEPEPMLHTVAPGGETTYELNVTNLGRTIDGSGLQDTIQLRLEGVPSGWEAAIDTERLALQGGESRDVTLRVSAGDDAAVGDRVTFQVVATSEANPEMRDTVRGITFVKVHFEVGLWFERVQGATSRNLVLDPGQVLDVPLVVQNLGSTEDRVDLTLAGGNEAGWVTRILTEDAEPLAPLTLGPEDVAVALLRVIAPDTEESSLVPFEVVAQSQGSSAAVAKVLGTAKIRTITDLRVQIDNDTRFVEPGRTGVFNVTLDNQGNDAINVLLNVSGKPRAGWSAPDVLLQGTSIRELSNLAPGNPVTVRLEVPVPGNATAFERTPVGFRAEAVTKDGSSLGSGEAILATVVVEPVRALEVSTPEGGYTILPTGRQPLTLNISNSGNTEELVMVEPTAWPGGWLVENVEPTTVDANTTASLVVQLSPTPHVPPGNYSMDVDIRSAGEVRNRTTVDLVVPPLRRVNATLLGNHSIIPLGRTEDLVLALENEGNVHREVEVNVTAEHGEALPAIERVSLAPGDRIHVPVRLALAGVQTEGTWNLTVRLDPAGIDADTQPPEVHIIPITTTRTNLRLDRVVAPRPLGALGSGDLFSVRAVVANEGPIDLEDVDVALLVDGEQVDAVRIGHLPVGPPRVATLAWRVEGHASSAEVVVNPDDSILELTREDNALAVDTSEGRSLLPGLVFPLLLAVLSVAARLSKRPVRLEADGGVQPPEVPPEEF